MGLFSPFVNWSRSQLNNLKSTTFEFFPLGESFGFNRVSEQDILNGGYLSNDVVYSVINKVAGVTASIPYIITKNDKPVDAKEATCNHTENDV